jgi:hypothetical protein
MRSDALRAPITFAPCMENWHESLSGFILDRVRESMTFTLGNGVRSGEELTAAAIEVMSQRLQVPAADITVVDSDPEARTVSLSVTMPVVMSEVEHESHVEAGE